MSTLFIEKICSCYFGKRLNVCCGNDKSDDCVETASSQRSFGVLISREGKKEQRRSEPRRDWLALITRTPSYAG